MAERELSPSQKAAIYIELGMLKEDRENTPKPGRPKNSSGSAGVSEGEAVVKAARKAGVGEHTMRDTEWLSKNTVTARRLEAAGGQIDPLPKHVHGRDGKSYEYAPRKRLEEEATPHLAYEAFRGAIGNGSGERERVFG